MDNQATSDIGVLDQFQNEFVEFWQRVPNKAFFFVLLLCWLAVFQVFGNAVLGYVDTPSLFRWMWTVYNARDNEGHMNDDSMGMWVPPLVLGLIWWKHKDLIALPLKTWWPGLLLLAMGALLHVVGFLIQQPRVSIVALLVGIYGIIGMAWGWKLMRGVFFPFFLLIFLIPFTSLIEPITFPLRLLSARIVEFISREILVWDVVREGTMLHDPARTYNYDVAAACSGIRSLVGIGLMATVGAFVAFKSWWRRGALLALVVPLAVVGNVLRLMTIIVAAKVGGQNAGNFVHEGGPGGIISLLPYVPAVFGLMYAARWMEEPKPSKSESNPA